MNLQNYGISFFRQRKNFGFLLDGVRKLFFRYKSGLTSHVQLADSFALLGQYFNNVNR